MPTDFAPPSPSADLARIRRSLLLALAVVAPWAVGIAVEEAGNGSVAAFGAYLLIVSFPTVPLVRPFATLGASALILSFFAGLGASIALGSPAFFIVAILAALAQAAAELRGGPLRLPVALGALAFFLAVGQMPAGGWLTYGGLFLAGALWGGLVAAAVLPRAPAKPAPKGEGEAAATRFLGAAAVTSLLGSLAAVFVPSSHPGWLPAAALRVLKPTRAETLRRMKQRGVGSLLGAAAGGLILGWASAAWLHALLVGGLVFAMLTIGAKRYGAWTFCLTAVALAFDLGPAAHPLPVAMDRVLLTVGGLVIAAVIIGLLPGSAPTPARGAPPRNQGGIPAKDA